MTGSTARLFHARVARDADLAPTSSAPPQQQQLDAADDLDLVSKDHKVERATCEYKCLDDGYLVGDRVYNKQYAHLYFQRLQNLSPFIRGKVKKKWPGLPVRKILEVEPGVECAVIGTVYKDMKLKPSVLDEYAKDKSLQPHLATTKFVSPDDTLLLEDEGARMALQCRPGPGRQDASAAAAIDPIDFVSGVCVAVRGVEEEGGHFQVTDVCFPGPASQRPVPAPPSSPSPPPPKYVALVSGLRLGDASADPLPLQLLADYVTGSLGDAETVGRIARMVVVGNVLGEVAEVPVGEDKREARESAKSLREADIFLTQVASSMPLDVMPGPSDPCNVSLPQQPFHRCLLPSTTCYANVGRVTNPHGFEMDGVSFMGTSGQNIDDVLRFVGHEDRVGARAATLEWGHTAPTAPDTLPAFPFVDRDPFLVTECPHVYFVGNQPKLKVALMEGPEGQRTRLISLPSFAETQTAVLVNLQDLSCHPITFASSLGN